MSNFDKKLYKKIGYKITFDALGAENATVQKILVDFHDQVIHKNSLHTANKLEKLIEEYPATPAFKNYLYNSYVQLNKKDLAEKTLDLMIKAHPGYLFGKIIKSHNLINAKKFEEVKLILGENLEISDIVDVNKVLHFSEYINYYEIVGKWYLEQDESILAEDCYNKMYEVDESHDKTKRLGYEIIQKRMDSSSMLAIKTREVKSFSSGAYEKRKKRPIFNHSETEFLYQYSFNDMDKDLIEIILSLPRQTLIEDLENALEDAIYRYDFFEKKKWDDDSNFFPLHAIVFLCHLKSVESLPKISNFLSQGEEFLEYWFGDYITEDLTFAFPMMGLDIALLPELKKLVLKRNVYTYAKALYTNFAEQIAHHQPENRTIVLSWFESILQEMLDNQTDKDLIDTALIWNLLSTLIDLKAIELSDLFRKTLEAFPESNKEFKDWEKDINLASDPHNIYPIPFDLEDYYTGKFRERRAKTNRKFEDIFDTNRPNYLMNLMLNRLLPNKEEEDDRDFYRPQPQIINEIKIGRNDPCHCGSGKKYKKCHGD